MKSQIFAFVRKLITHTILTSYLLMSIGQSYAMEESDRDRYEAVLGRNGFEYHTKTIERGCGQNEEYEDVELCQSRGVESISDRKTSEEHSGSRTIPQSMWSEGFGIRSNTATPDHCLFKTVQVTPPRNLSSDKSSRSNTPENSSSRTTPQSMWSEEFGIRSNTATPDHCLFKTVQSTPPRNLSSDKSSRSNTPENNSNRTTPQSMWSEDDGIRGDAGTPIYDLLSRIPPKFPNMPDVENGITSISLRVIALKKPISFLQGIEESPISRKSNDATDEAKTNSAEEEENKEESSIKPSLSDSFIHYTKSGISGASSLLGSTGLAILAYNLGARKNQEIAYILFINSLIANAILFYKNNMGFTMNDLPCDKSKSLTQNAYTCSSCLLKFTAAGISSIPAAYVSGIVTHDILPALSSTVYAFNFINTLLLFHKSQIAFVNYFDELLKLRKTKNEKIWFYKSRIEEVSALNRSEIHALYDKFIEAKEPGSKNITDDKFEDLMKQIKSTESDTQKQFWLKESAGIIFGPGLAGIFGGIYIFKVGFTLYNLFLQSTNSELSPKDMVALTYVGALILSIVQNTVQIKSAYEVFKACAIKLSRAIDTAISIRNPFISSENKRHISQFEQLQEYASDGLSILLAGGAAAARAELCIDYMKDPALLTFVLAGTSIAFFSTFYWAISSYFESFTEIGMKRSEIMAAIKSKIVL